MRIQLLFLCLIGSFSIFAQNIGLKVYENQSQSHIAQRGFDDYQYIEQYPVKKRANLENSQLAINFIESALSDEPISKQCSPKPKYFVVIEERIYGLSQNISCPKILVISQDNERYTALGSISFSYELEDEHQKLIDALEQL